MKDIISMGLWLWEGLTLNRQKKIKHMGRITATISQCPVYTVWSEPLTYSSSGVLRENGCVKKLSHQLSLTPSETFISSPIKKTFASQKNNWPSTYSGYEWVAYRYIGKPSLVVLGQYWIYMILYITTASMTPLLLKRSFEVFLKTQHLFSSEKLGSQVAYCLYCRCCAVNTMGEKHISVGENKL